MDPVDPPASGGAAPARGWRGLYAIVDPDLAAGRDVRDLAGEILAGGCGVLQLRAKGRAPRALLPLARELAEMAGDARVPFVVNDHVEIAQAVGAAGVHLGQDDLPVASARRLLDPGVAVGLSTHDLTQVQAGDRAGADLLGFGPVFPTRSKARPDPVVGLAGLRAACRATARPVVAIGGLTDETVGEAAAAGAPLVAIIRALAVAPDPRATAAALHRNALDAYRAPDGNAGEATTA